MKYICQVCGMEAEPEVVAALALNECDFWFIHHIERKGGVIRVLTCPGCNTLTQGMIIEAYIERIRLGFVRGYH